MDLASIFTKDGVLPRELMMNLDTIVDEQWKKSNLQFGFYQYNAEQIVEELMKETKEKSLEEIIIRQRRDTSFRPTDILRSLFEKLNIRSRQEKSNTYAMGYIRYKNLDFAILPLDAETLPQALRIMHDGKIDLSRLEDYLTRGSRFHTHFATYIHDVWRRIPTALGLPLIIGCRMPVVGGLEGEFKALLTPQGSNRLNGAKININVKPTVAIMHAIVMRTWNPLLSSGIKMVYSVKANLPIDTQIELMVNRKVQVKYKVKIPQEKKQIFALRAHVSTYTSRWPTDPKSYVEPTMKAVHIDNGPERSLTFEKTLGEKWMGIRVNIRGHWQQNPIRVFQRSPMRLITGENIIEVTMEKTRNAPNEIVTEVEAELLKENRMQKPEFEGFYSEILEQKIFEIESEEESDRDSSESEEREKRRENLRENRRNENRKQPSYNSEDERLRRQEFTRYVRE